MSETVLAALITGVFSVVAVLIPLLWKKKKKKPKSPPEHQTVPTAYKPQTNFDLYGEGFYGRGNELRHIRNLFLDHKKRLVTVTGFGGFGKTRLAKEVGQSLATNYEDGVWFVSFVEATTVEGMAKEVHDAFGLDSSYAQIDNGVQAVVDLLQNKNRLLLILDNFEHILEHAEATVSVWLKELPSVDFLVTSRFALNIKQEQQFKLDTLTLALQNETDLDKLKHNPAIQLFEDKAKQVDYGFELNTDNAVSINKICHKVEGIPLAIEIAAGYINISAEEILKSLKNELRFKNKNRDSDKRHETLHKVIEWSYNLLEPIEREVFLQLAIFKDGFDLPAARAVVNLDHFPDSESIVEILENLQQKSLLFRNKMITAQRFNMLVSVERFAENKLEELKPENYLNALIDRWSNYFIELLEKQQNDSAKQDQSKSKDVISDDIENIFSIQDTHIQKGNYETAAKTILLVANHLSIMGPALLRVPRLLQSYNTIGDESGLKGKLSLELARAHADRGELNEAELYAQKALEQFKKHNNEELVPEALLQIGSFLKSRGFFRLSLQTRQKALEAVLKLEKEEKNAKYHMWLASTYERLGNFKKSDGIFEEAVNLAKKYQDELLLCIIHSNWSLAKWHEGKAVEALKFNHAAQDYGRENENFKWKPALMTNEALILCELGRYDEAVDKSVHADILHKKQGSLHWAAVNYGSWGRALLRRNVDDDVEEAEQLLKKSLEVSRKLYWPDNIAMVLDDLAQIAFAQKNYQKCFACLLEAIALERRIGLIKEYRHYANLVLFGLTAKKLGFQDLQWESMMRAKALGKALRIDDQYPVERVANAHSQLEEAVADWEKEFGVQNAKPNPPSTIYNLPMEANFAHGLLDAIQARFEFPSYGYPWFNLEESLEEQGKKSILLFGYGSLLNKISAKETLNDTSVNQYRPSIAFGIKRLLDYNMPDDVRARSLYKNSTGPKELGLFNTRYTGSITDNINGAIIEIPIEEVKNLRAREIGYDLRPVICIDWPYNPDNPEFIHAYALGCSGRTWEGKPLTDHTLLPHRDYLELCRKGAEGLGDGFLRHFLQTSFLADGTTTVEAWEASDK
nr:NB-ARC domain-containing protein [Allomuricauda sp.]